jgi:ATP-binding cassette, subfamily B (MDR/TAP), member 1
MIIGAICAMLQGLGMPMVSLFFGDIANDFSGVRSKNEIIARVGVSCLKMTLVGLGVLLATWTSHTIWHSVGARQTNRIRKIYFRHLIYSDITWYDENNANTLGTKISEETMAI